MATSELMKKLAARQKAISHEEVANEIVSTTTHAVAEQSPTTPLGTYQAPVISVAGLKRGSLPSSIGSVSPRSSSDAQQISPTNKENRRTSHGNILHAAAKSGSTASSSSELEALLARQCNINDGKPYTQHRRMSVFAEFREFSRKQLQKLSETFKKFDSAGCGHMNLEDLKRLMESVGAPQTHIALKSMLREVDEDGDGQINLREFLLIFRKVAAGELQLDNGLVELALLGSIDVTKEGVIGARDFFEAKITLQTKPSAFEAEVRAEQEARRKQEEEARERREHFKSSLANFQK